ncbi:MAG TPA: helix-turn-helix domain-containing protein [Candidatus Paceibacterota bacterium]
MALPQTMAQNIAETLAHIGLHHSEVTVLLALLESNTTERVSLLSRRTKVNRITLYPILRSLSERGLVSSVEKGGVLVWRAIKPSLLVDYIERMQEKLANDIGKMREIVPFMEAKSAGRERKYPSIQFFEGPEGIKKVLTDTITGNPSKTIYGFSGTDATYKLMGPWVRDYIKRRVASGVKRYEIATGTPTSRESQARDAQENRRTHILPPGYPFEVEMSTYEDKVHIISFAEDYPVAVLIQDEKIAQVMKSLFQYIDKSLEKEAAKELSASKA